MNSLPRSAILIRLLRCVRLTLHLLKGLLLVSFFFPARTTDERLLIRQRWSAILLKILSLHISADKAEIASGSLVVANHISWLDVFVLNALHPQAFVAKAEVRQWFVLGWLAEKNDTVFLRRGSRGHARVVNAEIDALLAQGRCVALFPEGTTTDGCHLLGFHAALLQAAIETSCPVQPVAIAYCDEQGQRSTVPAYVGDVSLLASLWTILSCRRLEARIQVLPALSPAEHTRRSLAQAAHRAIALSLGLLPERSQPGTGRDLPAGSRSNDAPTNSPNPEPEASV